MEIFRDGITSGNKNSIPSFLQEIVGSPMEFCGLRFRDQNFLALRSLVQDTVWTACLYLRQRLSDCRHGAQWIRPLLRPVAGISKATHRARNHKEFKRKAASGRKGNA